MKTLKCFVTLLLVLSGLTLAACSRDTGNIKKLPTSQLSDRAFKCNDLTNPAPGAGVSCENIRKECQRRSKEKGYKVC